MGVDDRLITAHEANTFGLTRSSRMLGTPRRLKDDAKPENASKSQKAN
jgi:hypothetical protein